MNSSEGIPEPNNRSGKKSFIRDTLPAAAYVASSVGHVIAGVGTMSSVVPAPVTEILDNYSLTFSKTVNVANITYKGVEALRHNRAWEGLARLAYTAIVPWVPLESVYACSGFSSGGTMLEQGQRNRVKYKNGTEKNPKGTPESLIEDLRENIRACYQMSTELLTPSSLWGKDRKIFVSPDKDTGYTMFFSAWGNIAGATLGTLALKDFQGPIGKISAVVRNAGSLGCDWAKFIHNETDNKIAAVLYVGVSVFDVAKSFTTEEMAHTLSHFSNSLNNGANYFYANTTNKTTDGTYKGNELSQAA